jgi:very-short-patch-repair endonuclease
MRGPNERVKLERKLRRSATDAETKLWLSLRDRRLCGFKFVRQEAIGSYVVDFVCRDRRLIVEVDGGQHADNPGDRKRDRKLETAGYRVLRFWNNDVLRNRDGVLQLIADALKERTLSLSPFTGRGCPSGGEAERGRVRGT